MCGIVGYIGENRAAPIILEGLKKLEYRGYDSAGIALYNAKIKSYKAVGKIANLEKVVDYTNCATFGIGHTRWATHGRPSEANSHPHYSQDKRIFLVHNGVVENYQDLKNDYLDDVEFYSDTDSEVLANLISKFLNETGDIDKSIQKTMKVVEGSYALALIIDGDEKTMYAVKNKSPLLIGVGDDFNMLGSDALAMGRETSRVMELNDLEYAKITRKQITIFDVQGKSYNREILKMETSELEVDKGIFGHYMLKEIYDQPTVIRKLIMEYLESGQFNKPEIKAMLATASSVHIIAAGTSYYSGLVSKSLLERGLQKEVHVHIASEFVYDTPFLVDKPLFIFVSQSGETADSRAALVKVKKLGYATFTITNVANSTLAREADGWMLLHAGREIAVASTKAFVAQLVVFLLLARTDYENLEQELSKVSLVIEDIFTNREKLESIAKKYFVGASSCFYIGRGVDYKIALEGALKLKEISYIHTEGMSSGELKHGTIALIDEASPVVALISQASIADNTRSNIEEVNSRGANTITIVREGLSKKGDTIVYSDVSEEVAPIATVVVLQLLAYYTALHLGCDIDMPRNLAKSVTVE